MTAEAERGSARVGRRGLGAPEQRSAASAARAADGPPGELDGPPDENPHRRWGNGGPPVSRPGARRRAGGPRRERHLRWDGGRYRGARRSRCRLCAPPAPRSPAPRRRHAAGPRRARERGRRNPARARAPRGAPAAPRRGRGRLRLGRDRDRRVASPHPDRAPRAERGARGGEPGPRASRPAHLRRVRGVDRVPAARPDHPHREPGARRPDPTASAPRAAGPPRLRRQRRGAPAEPRDAGRARPPRPDAGRPRPHPPDGGGRPGDGARRLCGAGARRAGPALHRGHGRGVCGGRPGVRPRPLPNPPPARRGGPAGGAGPVARSGGIGMSGIAEVLLTRGYVVSGSDVVESETRRRLARLGARLYLGAHAAAQVSEDIDVLVISSAVTYANPEVSRARELKIPVIPRAEMLAELMRMKYGVAVAGSHGKTTTTSLTAAALREAGRDPTTVVGGKPP